jgi:hypothetical protein
VRRSERNLLLLALGAAGVWLLFSFLPWLLAGDANLSQKISEKETELKGLEDTISKGVLAQRKLNDFRHRSLPTSQEARTKYSNWLSSLVKQAKLDSSVSVKSQGGVTSGKVQVDKTGRVVGPNVPGKNKFPFVQYLQFTLSGQGTLKQFVQVLYNFYQGGTLQQIRSWTLKPLEKGQFEITINITAAQIRTADRETELTDAKGDTLARATAKEYEDLIVKRNVFAPYVPPAPVVAKAAPAAAPTPPPAFDVAKFAFLTGIVEKGGVFRALIYVRPTDKELWLAEGESFTVGQLKGTVVRIQSHDIVIRVDGKTFQIAEGESLRAGKEVAAVPL